MNALIMCITTDLYLTINYLNIINLIQALMVSGRAADLHDPMHNTFILKVG